MGLKSTDSLSSYKDTASLYHIGNPSSIKTEKMLRPDSGSRDTIEITREKLKEEALHRLRYPSEYLIDHPGFVRIGKYLFTAIVFPPI